MRVFAVPGYRKKVRLPERDYKRLLERTDVTKAEDNGDVSAIRTSCICEFYAGCRACPFGKVAGSIGCLESLRAVGLKTDRVHMFTDSVSWEKSHDKVARKELKAIRDALLSLLWLPPHPRTV